MVGQANLCNNNKNIDTRILRKCACLYFVCSYVGLCSVFCVFCGCGCGWLMVVLDKKLRQCSREWPLIRIIRSTTWLTSKWSGSRLGARQHPLWKPLNILTSVSWGRSILKAACQRFLPDHCRITKGNKASWCPRRCSAFQSLNTITKVSVKPCYNAQCSRCQLKVA